MHSEMQPVRSWEDEPFNFGTRGHFVNAEKDRVVR